MSGIITRVDVYFDDAILDWSSIALLTLKIVDVDMSTDDTYRVRENTGNSAHPTIDDVIELTLERAADPRPEENPGGHFDRYVSHAVEEHGESAVIECIRLVLIEGHPHRSAGAAAFSTEDYVAGIEVGVACQEYLRELLEE